MRLRVLSFLVYCVLASRLIVVQCAWARGVWGPTYQQQADARSVLRNQKGQVVGQAWYVQGQKGVLIRLNAVLPPGQHALHLHARGDCSDPPHFLRAGDHMHVTGQVHGYFYPGGPHSGDLPNIMVDRAGHVALVLYTEQVSLHGEGGRPALLTQTGTALVVHRAQDDYRSQPAGAAGPRIACGVVKQVGLKEKTQ